MFRFIFFYAGKATARRTDRQTHRRIVQNHFSRRFGGCISQIRSYIEVDFLHDANTSIDMEVKQKSTSVNFSTICYNNKLLVSHKYPWQGSHISGNQGKIKWSGKSGKTQFFVKSQGKTAKKHSSLPEMFFLMICRALCHLYCLGNSNNAPQLLSSASSSGQVGTRRTAFESVRFGFLVSVSAPLLSSVITWTQHVTARVDRSRRGWWWCVYYDESVLKVITMISFQTYTEACLNVSFDPYYYLSKLFYFSRSGMSCISWPPGALMLILLLLLRLTVIFQIFINFVSFVLINVTFVQVWSLLVSQNSLRRCIAVLPTLIGLIEPDVVNA